MGERVCAFFRAGRPALTLIAGMPNVLSAFIEDHLGKRGLDPT